MFLELIESVIYSYETASLSLTKLDVISTVSLQPYEGLVHKHIFWQYNLKALIEHEDSLSVLEYVFHNRVVYSLTKCLALFLIVFTFAICVVSYIPFAFSDISLDFVYLSRQLGELFFKADTGFNRLFLKREIAGKLICSFNSLFDQRVTYCESLYLSVIKDCAVNI